MNKQELSKELGISLTSVGNLLRRGMPFLEKGSTTKEWKFNADECKSWYEDYKKTYSGKGETIPNIFKILTTFTVFEFFSYITEQIGESPVLDFIGKKNKLSKVQMEKVFFDVYHIAAHCLNEWQKDNLIDKACEKQLSFSLDGLFKMVLPNAKVSGGSCNNRHELRIPEIIVKMHKKLNKENLLEGKSKCQD